MKQKLSQIAWKKLKHILKKRRLINFQSQKVPDAVLEIKTCNNSFPACDEAFIKLSSFVNDTSAAVRYFNKSAKKLLKLHQATAGFRKYLILFEGKVLMQRTHDSMFEEGNDLISFALRKVIQIQNFVKEFDEVYVDYCCKQGVAMKSQAQSMQNEILQSPWLRELMAMNINLRGTNVNSGIGTASSEGYHIRFSDGSPSLSCELIDSIKIDVDLTCPVCLEIVFDPISLRCGHILCKLCACSAASVTIVDGLKSAQPQQKCPVCRQARVYGGAVRCTELSILLSRSCREYWEKRLRMERVERIKQAKMYWESQSRAFVGI